MTIWQRIQKTKKDEQGASFLLFFLLLFMVVFLIFGLAFDLALLRSAQSEVQSTLDSATVAGATQLVTNKNTLDKDATTELGHEFYAKNRKGVFGLRCLGSAEVKKAVSKGANKSSLMSDDEGNCQWIKAREVVSKNSYRLSTYECVSTVFLSPIMPEYCFFADSTSRTSQIDN